MGRGYLRSLPEPPKLTPVSLQTVHVEWPGSLCPSGQPGVWAPLLIPLTH